MTRIQPRAAARTRGIKCAGLSGLTRPHQPWCGAGSAPGSAGTKASTSLAPVSGHLPQPLTRTHHLTAIMNTHPHHAPSNKELGEQLRINPPTLHTQLAE